MSQFDSSPTVLTRLTDATGWHLTPANERVLGQRPTGELKHIDSGGVSIPEMCFALSRRPGGFPLTRLTRGQKGAEDSGNSVYSARLVRGCTSLIFVCSHQQNSAGRL